MSDATSKLLNGTLPKSLPLELSVPPASPTSLDYERKDGLQIIDHSTDSDRIMKVERILLVDDDKDSRALCALAARRSGHWTVFEAVDGESALECISETAPDLIILDIFMPGIGGLETLARLKSDPKSQNIPVIFLTASSDSETISNHAQLGAAGLISKPINPRNFHKEVREIISRL